MSAPPSNQMQEGTVLRVSRGEYVVKTAYGTFNCKLRGKLRKEFVYSTSKSRAPRVQRVQPTQSRSPVSIGDHVRIRSFGPGTGVIEEILRDDDETWGIIRQAPESKRAHVLAANVDQIVIVLAASQPSPDFILLDRYLVIAEYHTLPTLLVLNKIDRGIPAEVVEEFSGYQRLGYTVLHTSVPDCSGIATLRDTLQGMRTVFSGVSGVGKSSLINSSGGKLRTADGRRWRERRGSSHHHTLRNNHARRRIPCDGYAGAA